MQEKRPETSEEDDKITRAEKSLLQKIARTKLVTTKAEIEVLRQDPFSPLHSIKNFEALNLYVSKFYFKVKLIL